jgi:hypothetical protein
MNAHTAAIKPRPFGARAPLEFPFFVSARRDLIEELRKKRWLATRR